MTTLTVRRALISVLSCLLAVSIAGAAAASPTDGPPGLALDAPTGVSAATSGRSVVVSWDRVSFPQGVQDPGVEVLKDGAEVAALEPGATSFRDGDVGLGGSYSYTVVAVGEYGTHQLSAASEPVTIELPDYLVGAATADITPVGVVNLGGFGLGDGSVIPDEVIGRGGMGETRGERIAARAMVVDDGENAIAIADIETQGMFAAYQDGPYGLSDMANAVAEDTPGLPADHILIAADHTHSGPDTIGVWGGVSTDYLEYVKEQTVAAIESAYEQRTFAGIEAGHSDASDLIYNQSCSEALNQSKEPDYPGPELCATPGKDGGVRVLQATTPQDDVVVTYMAFAAHATAGGGNGLHGDWPQFLSEAMSERYGGVGIAMVGALGGTQPCRSACAFTSPDNPGYDIPDRKTAIVTNYMAHVAHALADTSTVEGPVAARQSYIREAITGPAVLALFTGGKYFGTEIMRSHENPWVVGTTIRTVASALRVGGVLFAGTPGEGFPAIRSGIADAIEGEQEVIQLGLANDQLGYLIAPVSYVPVIAAEAAVNDNIIFNVSPTIGDHVMCADLALALDLGFEGSAPAGCAPYIGYDSAGDPVASVPVGGIVPPSP